MPAPSEMSETLPEKPRSARFDVDVAREIEVGPAATRPHGHRAGAAHLSEQASAIGTPAAALSTGPLFSTK